MITVAASTATQADPCRAPEIGDGVVSAVNDARNLRLGDGRDILLTGIRSYHFNDEDRAQLTAQLSGERITLHAHDDQPDRYGRQHAYAYRARDGQLLQSLVLERGLGLLDLKPADDCRKQLQVIETKARAARHGIWSRSVIKRAESAGDILTMAGQFALAEGTIRSVRQAGATTFVNFGQRGEDGLSLTMSRRAQAELETAGIRIGQLTGSHVLVRGWIAQHARPRLTISSPGQIMVTESGKP